MIEARKATLAAAHVWGPVYLRFQREKTPVMTTDATPFIPGRAEIFWVRATAARAWRSRKCLSLRVARLCITRSSPRARWKKKRSAQLF